MASRGVVLAFFAASVLASAALALHAEAAATLAAEGLQTYYTPSKPFSGSLKITFDRLLPQNSQVIALIDGSYAASLDITPFVNGTYLFKSYQFTYNITATGKNEWTESPAKQFYYKISAKGTCGNQGCVGPPMTCDCAGLCTPPSTEPYKCDWTITSGFSSLANVSANDYLKFIVDGRGYISPPFSQNPDDTVWMEVSNNPSISGVQTTMRQVCGNYDFYQYQITDEYGWIRRSLPLPDESFKDIPGTTNKIIEIENFDEKSLTIDRAKFVEGGCSQAYACGGIYKNGIVMNSGYLANGTNGEIIIYDFDPAASYYITYFPPNGPMLCAYSSSRMMNSTTWERTAVQTGTVSYDKPFGKVYTSDQLPYAFNGSLTFKWFNDNFSPPDCPNNQACSRTVNSYAAYKTSDPSGSYIALTFNPQARTVNATVSSTDLSASYTKYIPFSNFTGFISPSAASGHTLAFILQEPSGPIASSPDYPFFVCSDSDGDGYCKESGDCNDTNPHINPGATELCNGRDDDCNGQVDEDYMIAGKMLNSKCGLGKCQGTWVCSMNQTAVVCSAAPTPKKEICNNGIDDDCDGVIDEEYDTTASGIERCDPCEDGQKESCKASIGECAKKPGYRACVSGRWSICIGATQSQTEECNGKDEDCSGIIDDVAGGTSVASTSCGCYAGGYASAELCDNVDNDCNGLIDDGIKCCDQGQTRSCGPNKGICRAGTQSCGTNSEWMPGCSGSSGPDPQGEICLNKLDDDCDGTVDEENCIPQEVACISADCNSLPLGYILVAVGIILIIATVTLVEMRKPH